MSWFINLKPWHKRSQEQNVLLLGRAHEISENSIGHFLTGEKGKKDDFNIGLWGTFNYSLSFPTFLRFSFSAPGLYKDKNTKSFLILILKVNNSEHACFVVFVLSIIKVSIFVHITIWIFLSRSTKTFWVKLQAKIYKNMLGACINSNQLRTYITLLFSLIDTMLLCSTVDDVVFETKTNINNQTLQSSRSK